MRKHINMKKYLGMLVMAGLLVGSGRVNAAIINWTGAGGDNLWRTAANWDSSSLPGAADEAYLATDGLTALIDGTTAAEAYHVRVANTSGNVSLDVTTGGTLAITKVLYLGYGGNATVGTMNVNGGSVSAETVYVGNWGSGVLNMNAGTLNAVAFKINNANNALTSGHVQLDGGIIDTSWFVPKTGGTMDITGGSFVYSNFADGGTGTTIEEVIANGYITAYNGAGSVLVDTTSVPGRTVLAAIPEPSTLGLFALIGGGMVWIRSRKLLNR